MGGHCGHGGYGLGGYGRMRGYGGYGRGGYGRYIGGMGGYGGMMGPHRNPQSYYGAYGDYNYNNAPTTYPLGSVARQTTSTPLGGFNSQPYGFGFSYY